ncbi:MAG: 2-oxoacid:acceptor oxidoreductase family protein [Mycoplasmataceae bacterium]|nr:2-oxoacid:acceptor oxidoreductase family protein [Mycoplasmataceae bacterium]
MKNLNIKVAGFGGQGVMMFGKILSYAAVQDNKQTLWYPSYGPETRGGTANCSVIIADTEIDSPVFKTIDNLIAFNAPSLQKFANDVAHDGFILYNTSLIDKKDFHVKAYGVPVNDISLKLGLPQAANMVMIGAYLEITKLFDDAIITAIIKHILGERKAKFVPINLEAIAQGRQYIKNLK